MAWFTKKEWKNRLAEFAGRRTLTDVATGSSQVVDVARNEGTISQEGDAFSAANMNEFEQRILEAFLAAENANTELNQNMGGLRFYENSTGKYVVGADSVPKKLGSLNPANNKSYTIPAGHTQVLCIAMGCSGEGGYPKKINKPTGNIIKNVTDVVASNALSQSSGFLSFANGGVLPMLYVWLVETNGNGGTISFSINAGGIYGLGNAVVLLD